MASVGRFGQGEVLQFTFDSSGLESVYRQMVWTEKVTASFRFLWENTCIKQTCKHSYYTFNMLFAHLFSLAYYVVVTNIRGHIADPSPLPTTCYCGGNSPQVDILFPFLYWKSINGILLGNTRGIHRQPAHSNKGKHRYSKRGTMT